MALVFSIASPALGQATISAEPTAAAEKTELPSNLASRAPLNRSDVAQLLQKARIALAAGALGTGRAQASIGAGGTGALAEKPELFTNVLILVAIPETLVVFGFVIAIMIMGKI